MGCREVTVKETVADSIVYNAISRDHIIFALCQMKMPPKTYGTMKNRKKR